VVKLSETIVEQEIALVTKTKAFEIDFVQHLTKLSKLIIIIIITLLMNRVLFCSFHWCAKESWFNDNNKKNIYLGQLHVCGDNVKEKLITNY